MKKQLKNKNILTIIGTRPEVIKMAPVVKAIENSSYLSSFVCTTSQHRQMQDDMVKLFELNVDFDLDIMKPGQTLVYTAATILTKLSALLENLKPGLILVHGDTTTSFIASLAAFYQQIPIGHIEAGLRTYDLNNPFPEEANRQLTSKIASLHFAPTEWAESNLLKEGILPERIFITGNTVIDALLWAIKRLDEVHIIKDLPEIIVNLVKKRSPYVLITAHRRESFGDGFLSICRAIMMLAKSRPDWNFIYPVHLNPNVKDPVYKLLSNLPNVYLISPVGYFPFVYLMKNSRIILSDSGGVQEEAPSLGKPVLVMRDRTERPEGVKAGVIRLVGTDCDKIIQNVLQLIDDTQVYLQMTKTVNPYGDGYAAKKICDIIESCL